MIRRHFALLLPLVLLPVHGSQAQDKKTQPAKPTKPLGSGFLVCYPNAPGSTRAAKPVMGRFGSYLSERLKRTCDPIYYNAPAPAFEWLKENRPRYAILSLALYLRWRDRLRLSPVSATERSGATEERFYLLVNKTSPHKKLSDLAALPRAARIWSSHLDDPRFATNVVFGGSLVVKEVQRRKAIKPAFKTGTVRIVSSSRAISALRRMLRGRKYKKQPVDAVVVDSTAWRALQKLEMFKGVVRVLYKSPTLPTPPVVALRGVSEAEAKRLSDVLSGMKKDTEGKQLLKTLQLTGFQAASTKGLAAARVAYGKKVSE